VTTGFRIRACCAALGYFIEANLECSQRSLLPIIRYRNTVPYDHPSRNLFIALYKFLLQLTQHGSPIEMFEAGVAITIETLMTLLLVGRADVRDVFDNGNSIAHVCFRTSMLLIRCQLTYNS
jgi:hypothetical protein